MRHVAVVGSGPSGCYVAEALLRGDKDCRIDVVERLATPFGLVRFGVAPDHQTTKAVSRLLDRVLARPEVGFYGGIELGADVTLDELRALYDAVVLATGAPLDRRLGVPGETLPGVVTAGQFVGWYNHHPHHADIELATVRRVVVIGNGNVALDVARVLAKTESEFHGSDLDHEVAAAIASSPLQRIDVVGRKGAAQAKFTAPELAEFATLARAHATLDDPAALDGVDGAVADALRTACAGGRGDGREIRFHFGLTPLAFQSEHGRLAAVRLASAAGEERALPAELAVTCIGYETHGHGLRTSDGALASDDGRIDAGLYAVGWAKRGPSGTIPTNRTEALTLARRILAEVTDGGRAGGAGLHALLAGRAAARVDYAGWRRIDASEIERGGATRARRKWRSLAELAAAARARDEARD